MDEAAGVGVGPAERAHAAGVAGALLDVAAVVVELRVERAEDLRHERQRAGQGGVLHGDRRDVARVSCTPHTPAPRVSP